MTRFFLATLCAVALGCNANMSTTDSHDPSAPADTDHSLTAEDRLHEESGAADPDNTGVNVRDRHTAMKTPIDQNENQGDIDITAQIRQRIVDSNLSTNAHNVKIMTQDGKVTLRGPVDSAGEKAQIEKWAQEVAGAGNVDNQLEVHP